jgi:hypothetical protein
MSSIQYYRDDTDLDPYAQSQHVDIRLEGLEVTAAYRSAGRSLESASSLSKTQQMLQEAHVHQEEPSTPGLAQTQRIHNNPEPAIEMTPNAKLVTKKSKRSYLSKNAAPVSKKKGQPANQLSFSQADPSRTYQHFYSIRNQLDGRNRSNNQSQRKK